ncbi:MAG: hypothetical protein ACLQNE_29190 [Thermoguttaceae bacterium]|jgi:hypothetical protein
MSTLQQQDLAGVLETVKQWPPKIRVSLARMILETVESPEPFTSRHRGLTAAELMDVVRTDKPAPDDQTVRQWIDEHRTEKYGR